MSATGVEAVPPAAADDALELVLPGRALPAGAGWRWITGGWALFMRAPLMWVIAMVVLFVLGMVLSLLPIVGSLAFQVLQAVFAGSLVAACRSLERGGEFEIEHLLAGFQRRFANLLIVGALLMLGGLAVLMVFALFAGFSVLTALLTGDPDAAAAAIMASAGVLVLGLLVVMALLVPYFMAYWFAPALVMMHDLAPVAAMKASFVGCARNLVPFLVYGLVMALAGIVAVIPFGLGLLVWMPLVITSTYVAYRDIFTEEAAAPLPAVVP